MAAEVILWRRFDRPGHEFARLTAVGGGWELSGAALFLHESHVCRLDYAIACNAAWETSSATVQGSIGHNRIDVSIEVDRSRGWRLNGELLPELTDCIDLDLNFSPSTNLLPIRRLGLPVGQSAEVTAAWLRFPSFRLEPLAQVHRRTGEASYRYESADGSFVRDLDINAVGFVTRYPDFWIEEQPA